MTAIAQELRPGLAWLALVAVGVLLAGTAFMLAVLPSVNHRFVTPAGDDPAQADTVSRRGCPTPLASAFDDIGSSSGWFDVGIGEPIIISADSYCTIPARRRLSLALVLGFGALALVGVGLRCRSGPQRPPLSQ